MFASCLLCLILAAEPTVLEEFHGKVINVSDGDTIKILIGKETIKVRLEGIDAPESGQPFGTKSKQVLDELVHGKDVTVKKTGVDKYGRTLGRVMLGDQDINATMVQSGMAWHYKEYSKSTRLALAEAAARSAERGLWSDKDPVPPWKWRKDQKETVKP